MSYLLKLLLEKYDLRFEMDSAGTGKVSFCEHIEVAGAIQCEVPESRPTEVP